MGHYYIGQAGLKKIFQLIKTKLTEYARNEDLADVATTGAYTDLVGEPTKVSDLPNDAGYLTEHQSLAAYAKTADVTTALGLKADKTEIPTLDEEPTNGSENGVTSGGVYTAIQEAIQEGAGITVDTEMSDTSTNPVQNKAVKAAIDTVERVSSNAYHITSGVLPFARGGTGVSSLAALQAEILSESTVDTEISGTSENPVQNKVIKAALDLKAGTSDLAGKANVNHTHSASDLTSGELSISQGGTGETTPERACYNLTALSLVPGINDPAMTRDADDLVNQGRFEVSNQYCDNLPNVTELEYSTSNTLIMPLFVIVTNEGSVSYAGYQILISPFGKFYFRQYSINGDFQTYTFTSWKMISTESV